MKRKVIDVKYRKDSTKFPKWMKYEITILNEDGSTEKIPAYGKDLQDALSRVVHDTKVEQATKVVDKIPSWVWPFAWLISMGVISYYITTHSSALGVWIGPAYIGGMLLVSGITLSISNWFTLRNKDND
jgi:hypothetical protein